MAVSVAVRVAIVSMASGGPGQYRLARSQTCLRREAVDHSRERLQHRPGACLRLPVVSERGVVGSEGGGGGGGDFLPRGPHLVRVRFRVGPRVRVRTRVRARVRTRVRVRARAFLAAGPPAPAG